MIKFEKVTPGMVLLDIHSGPLGNTTLRTLGCWRVEVVSVDPDSRTAMCRWNSNAPRKYTERQLSKLYTKPTKAYLAQCERKKRGGL